VLENAAKINLNSVTDKAIDKVLKQITASEGIYENKISDMHL
jgi:hypothetical protein